MKKIISLVCVIAIMFSFAVTVSAAENEFTLDLVSQDAESAVYALNMNTTYSIQAFSIYLDMADALAKGATVSIAKGAAGVAAYNAAQKMCNITYSPTDGSRMTGANTLATITFNTAEQTDAFAITQKVGSRFTYAVAADNPEDGSKLTVTSDFAHPTATVAMFKPAFTPETIEGTEVAATATEVELDKVPATAYKNVYTNVAVFNAELGADVKYGEAGFIWVKDGVKTANKFTVDASVITGSGTFDYGVVMVGVPADVTISAIPYYVTAE